MIHQPFEVLLEICFCGCKKEGRTWKCYNLPVIMTSVRFVPKMRLLYLPAAASLPLPYDGNASITGHSFIS